MQKSINEWLHERGFDEVDIPPREGYSFTPSRRECSIPFASAEATMLSKDVAEERKTMEFATNTQKTSIMDVEAEKPTMPK